MRVVGQLQSVVVEQGEVMQGHARSCKVMQGHATGLEVSDNVKIEIRLQNMSYKHEQDRTRIPGQRVGHKVRMVTVSLDV